MKREQALALLMALSVAAAACGTAKRSEPVAGPFTSDDAEVRRGEVMFATHCAKCHDGGLASLGPSITNKPLPQFLMKFQVRHGLGAMPSFSDEQISDDDLDAITEYIVALRRHD